MTVMVVGLSESLGPQQCVDEVDHQPHCHESRERIVEDHGNLPLFSEAIAGDRVTDRQREETEANRQQDDCRAESAVRNADEMPLAGYVFEVDRRSTI
jgi:hypothetical protein